MGVAGRLVACVEVGLHGVADAEAAARYLVGICRADAFARGADFGSAFGALSCGVEQAVGGHYQVCLFGYFEDRVQVYAIGFELLGFCAEQHGVEHHAVAYHVHPRSSGEHARRNGA